MQHDMTTQMLSTRIFIHENVWTKTATVNPPKQRANELLAKNIRQRVIMFGNQATSHPSEHSRLKGCSKKAHELQAQEAAREVECHDKDPHIHRESTLVLKPRSLCIAHDKLQHRASLWGLSYYFNVICFTFFKLGERKKGYAREWGLGKKAKLQHKGIVTQITMHILLRTREQSA